MGGGSGGGSGGWLGDVDVEVKFLVKIQNKIGGGGVDGEVKFL